MSTQPSSANALFQLGVIASLDENLTQARLYLEQALVIQEFSDDQHGSAFTLATLSHSADKEGNYIEMCSCWQKSLTIFDFIRIPSAEEIRGWLQRFQSILE